jgi:hypothetical protein
MSHRQIAVRWEDTSRITYRLLEALPPDRGLLLGLARSDRDFPFVELVRDRIHRRLFVDLVDGVQVLLPTPRGAMGPQP